MTVILDRDYPYQVALSFDDAAMDILDWLERCDFEWDMYVDPRRKPSGIAFAH
jgi:hypothetical protein